MANKSKKLKTVDHSQSQSRAVDNTRGSMLWAYNHYRTSMLTSLLNDLIHLENNGLDENYCRQVRLSLESFANLATEVPSGGFLTGNLFKEVEKFAKLYEKWNGIEGTTLENVKQRRELLTQLRKQRQKITDKVRSLQLELANNLDRQIIASTYKAIGDLVTMVPDVFKDLAGAYSDYIKRGGITKP